MTGGREPGRQRGELDPVGLDRQQLAGLADRGGDDRRGRGRSGHERVGDVGSQGTQPTVGQDRHGPTSRLIDPSQRTDRGGHRVGRHGLRVEVEAAPAAVLEDRRHPTRAIAHECGDRHAGQTGDIEASELACLFPDRRR